MANPYLAETNPYLKSNNPYMESKESLFDRFVKATGAESDMMSNPASGEILANAATSGVSWIPAGIVKAAGIVSGQREASEDLANLVQEKLTYQPKSEIGNAGAELVAKPFEMLSAKSKELADKTYEATGSPLLATLVRTGIESIPFIAPVAGAKGVKALKGVAKESLMKDIGGLEDMKFRVEGKPVSITPEVNMPKEVKVEPVKAEVPKEEAKATATAEPKQPWEMTHNDEVNPSLLNFTEKEQHRIQQVREMYEPDDMPPITVIDGKDIIDGHNRVSIAKENRVPIRTVSISRQLFDKLKNKGYDEIEISYAMLTDAGYPEFAYNLNKQFSGAGVKEAGMKAFDVIEKQKIITIKQAISEGKPVPKEVLKDYPDLQPKVELPTTEPPKPEVPLETPLEGKPAKSAVDVNKVIAEKGFEALPDEELAKYNPITKADTISKIDTLLKADESSAIEMAKGNMPIPNDIQAQVLFNTVEKLAEQKGDIQTLMDLAKSPLAEQRSLSAQNLGASAWNKIKDTIVEKIQEVKKARESKITDVKMKEKVSKSLKEETQKINLSKEELSWDRFLSKIEC